MKLCIIENGVEYWYHKETFTHYEYIDGVWIIDAFHERHQVENEDLIRTLNKYRGKALLAEKV